MLDYKVKCEHFIVLEFQIILKKRKKWLIGKRLIHVVSCSKTIVRWLEEPLQNHEQRQVMWNNSAGQLEIDSSDT